MTEDSIKAQLIIGSLIIITIILCSALIGVIENRDTIDETFSNTINNSFSEQYKNKMTPESEFRFTQIVNKISQIDNTSEKIIEIANWTISNFTNCRWNPELCWEDPSTGSIGWKPYEPSGTYWCDNQGNIRVKKGIFLDDPFWIEYYRTGACGELAHLFSEVANRSGFEVRVVSSNPSFDHAWNEVNISNEWKYVDLTIYWNYWEGDPNYSNKWFNDTKYYRCNCYNVTKITVVKTNKDVTTNYPYTC